MDKFRKINNFDIQQLNEFHGLTIYDNQLFLNDCIDYKWEAIFKSFPPLPFKMRFTVIFMCVGGEGHALISGNEYSVKENDVIMVSIGNIIETMEVSDDFKAISVAIDPESSLISFTYSSTRFLRDSLYDPKVLHLTPLRRAAHDSILLNSEEYNLAGKRHVQIRGSPRGLCHACEFSLRPPYPPERTRGRAQGDKVEEQ